MIHTYFHGVILNSVICIEGYIIKGYDRSFKKKFVGILFLKLGETIIDSDNVSLKFSQKRDKRSVFRIKNLFSMMITNPENVRLGDIRWPDYISEFNIISKVNFSDSQVRRSGKTLEDIFQPKFKYFFGFDNENNI